MDVVEAARSGAARPAKPARSGWLALWLAGAAAFWSANLVISLTPSAAAYRSALSIRYVPMLLEAAAGELIVAGVLALGLVRFPGRIPGAGPVRKALFLAVCALVVVTVLVEVPSKFGADVEDRGRWLFVATVFNTVRVLALGLAIGLVARARQTRADPHPLVRIKEKKP